MRDQAALREKPLAIGGKADQRGVIATCNYPARAFGVRSAMPTSQAIKLCPDLIVMPPTMEKYRVASRHIMSIYRDYTELVEPLSLDEAYLDVSTAPHEAGSATRMAQAIRARVAQEVGITVSAGVAPNKFLAKIASDWNKPDGLFVILPRQVDAFVAELPVDRLFGVGKVTAQKLHQLDIKTCLDLRAWSKLDLCNRFGKMGSNLYALSRGIDNRSVQVNSERKSLSVEETYTHDLADLAACLAEIPTLFADLQKQIQRTEQMANIHKLNIKIRFRDFKQTTVECIGKELDIDSFIALVKRGYARRQMPVRLLGLGVGIQIKKENLQYALF